MKKISLYIAPFLVLALPLVASAQALQPLQNLIQALNIIVARLVPLLMGVALVVFFWGLVQYIRKPEAEEGKKIMIAGLASLFVMASVWGIIALAQNALGVSNNTGPTVPSVPVSR